MNKEILLVDSTLRDGEQMAGIAFSADEKAAIAILLDKAGVHVIEAGTPVMGGEEKDAVKRIAHLGLKAAVCTWNRMILKDIKASLECGVKFLHLSAPVSEIQIRHKLGKTRKDILKSLYWAVSYARDYGCTVSVGAEDASRSDPGFLTEFAQRAMEYGAVRLRYADTVGVMEPFSVYSAISNLRKFVQIEIEFHGHNDFGLATANTLAAVMAGAEAVSTTVNGFGERAGNAPLDEVYTGLKYVLKQPVKIKAALLPELSQMVSRAARINIPQIRTGEL
ncbi:MAG: homocitrate synthase [Dehalobacterium sp.]